MKGEPTTLTLKFPGGLNNRSRENEIPDTALRVADNLSVTNAGGLLCRKGARRVLSGSVHSPFDAGEFLLLVVNGVLSRFDGIGSATSLVTLSYDVPVRYASLNGSVYWVTQFERGRIDASGLVAPWGIETPPQIRAVATTGGLRPGDYWITYTAMLPSGLESGAPAPVSVSLPSGGGINVTVPSGSGVAFNVYLSPPDGTVDEIRYAIRLLPGTSATVDSPPLGRLLESLLAVRPFTGQALCAYRGRLWIGQGSVIWYTSERSPHWLFPDAGFISTPDQVTLLGAVEDGIYLGTNSAIWFLAGNDPNEMTMRQVSSVGAVEGTGMALPDDAFSGEGTLPSTRCAWMDTEGYFCVGYSGGAVARPTKVAYCAGRHLSGASGFWQYEGLRQAIIVLSDNGIPAQLSAVDTPLHEINQYGTTLP
ncbi:MAG: hypothetical protein IPI57_20695 [Candidatus Competibacteraceae bacterium]|nr:hypothetical protein [Candidatus Competibacteraceae bacterium]